jgi:hypothetical protein
MNKLWKTVILLCMGYAVISIKTHATPTQSHMDTTHTHTTYICTHTTHYTHIHTLYTHIHARYTHTHYTHTYATYTNTIHTQHTHFWYSRLFHFTNIFAGFSSHDFFLCWSMFSHCLTLCRTRAVVSIFTYSRHTYDVWTETDSSLGVPREGVQRKQSCGATHSFTFVLNRTEHLT